MLTYVHVKGHGGARLTRSAGVRNGPHIWILWPQLFWVVIGFFFFFRGGGRGGRIPSIRQHVRVLRVSVLIIRFFLLLLLSPYPSRPPLHVVKTRVPDRLRRGLAQPRPLHLHPDSLDLLPQGVGQAILPPHTFQETHTQRDARAQQGVTTHSAS